MTTRKREFDKAAPSKKQQKSNKWNARRFSLKNDHYTDDRDHAYSYIMPYPTPGRGVSGESSN